MAEIHLAAANRLFKQTEPDLPSAGWPIAVSDAA
jgi:hypothetical protein